MGLQGPTGKLRRVAVGETLRRITSKLALEVMGGCIQAVLKSYQVGVRTPPGTEHHSRDLPVEQEMFSRPGRSSRSRRLRNSFNCRSQLTLWVDLYCAFRMSPRQWRVNTSVRGSSGVSLGPALFSGLASPPKIMKQSVDKGLFCAPSIFPSFLMTGSSRPTRVVSQKTFLMIHFEFFNSRNLASAAISDLQFERFLCRVLSFIGDELQKLKRAPVQVIQRTQRPGSKKSGCPIQRNRVRFLDESIRIL